MAGAFQSGAFQDSAFQVGGATPVTPTGGGGVIRHHHYPRRPSDEETRRERIRLGIVQAEKPKKKALQRIVALPSDGAPALSPGIDLEAIQRQRQFEQQLIAMGREMARQHAIQDMARQMEQARLLEAQREEEQILQLLMEM